MSSKRWPLRFDSNSKLRTSIPSANFESGLAVTTRTSSSASRRNFFSAGLDAEVAEILVRIFLHLLHRLHARILVVPDDHVGKVGSVVWFRLGVGFLSFG